MATDKIAAKQNGSSSWSKLQVAVLTFLLTALLSVSLYTFVLVDRVSAAEQNIKMLTHDIALLDKTTDRRITTLVGSMNEWVSVAKSVLDQNTVLIAELRAAKAHP